MRGTPAPAPVLFPGPGDLGVIWTRDLVVTHRRFRRGNGRPDVGGLFNGRPPLNPNTGPRWIPQGANPDDYFLPYQTLVLDRPMLARPVLGGGVTQRHDAAVTVEVGGEGGAVTREVIVGTIPIFFAVGQYENVDVRVSAVGTSVPGLLVRAYWCDRPPASYASILMPGRPVTHAGATGESAVPEGTVEVESQNAVTLTWTIELGGAAVTHADVLPAGGRVSVKGSTYTTSAACQLMFWQAGF